MIYRWRCKVCGNEVEVERKYIDRDNPPVICETCCDHPSNHCRGDWERIPSKAAIAVKGQFTAKNGYSK